MGKANPDEPTPPLNGGGNILVPTYFVANPRALGLTEWNMKILMSIVVTKQETCDPRHLTFMLNVYCDTDLVLLFDIYSDLF